MSSNIATPLNLCTFMYVLHTCAQDGKTAYDLANDEGYEEVVDYLKSKIGRESPAPTNVVKSVYNTADDGEEGAKDEKKEDGAEEKQDGPDMSPMTLIKISGMFKREKERSFEFQERRIIYKDADGKKKGEIPVKCIEEVSERNSDGFFDVCTKDFHDGGFRLKAVKDGEYARFKSIVKHLQEQRKKRQKAGKEVQNGYAVAAG